MFGLNTALLIALTHPETNTQRLCFLRWLAMANQPGGGFLADYDTFPLAWTSDTIPNGGRLTVYEYTGSGGVPSLLSANQNEWFRFAWALVENAIQHKQEAHWSDMKAIQDIYQQSEEEAYIMNNGVLSGMAVLHGKGYPEETCDRASTSFAVHFSHYSIDKGILPEGIDKLCEKCLGSGPQARAAVAEEWLKGWRKNCAVQSASTPAGVQETGVQGGVQAQSQEEAQAENPVQNTEPAVQMRDAMAPRGDKPIIFTFYENVDEPHRTGMSREDDSQLIQAWARSWQEVGWDPRVLDMSVARQHPEFATFDGFLEGVPFGKVDRVCFYRYLAVGIAGGGWMSDYDTFPLNSARWDGSGDPNFIPNNGDLTVHEQSDNGGIPSLVSGNAGEWFRLAKAQVENAKSHNTEPHWSDAKALQDIYQQSGGTFYKMTENVVMGDAIIRNKEISGDTCAWLRTKLAVHFSHFSMHRTGRWKTGMEAARHRAPVGRNWLLEYRQACAVYDSGS